MNSKPTVELDQHGTAYAADWQNMLRDIRQQCPVAWTDSNDGHWILTRHADITAAARDIETFSNEHDVTGSGTGFKGIAIPASPFRAVPLELDPPLFHEVRGFMSKSFHPRAAAEWRPWLQDTVDELIDAVVESGEMDLIYDLGAALPGRFTMKFLGLPEDDWETYALPFHDFMSPPGTARFERAITDLLALADRLHTAVVERRATPRDDFITHITRQTVAGEPITDQMATEICYLVVAGGVDTTTSVFGDAVEWLGRNTDERRRLQSDPDLLDRAIEEFLRYFSPTQGTARTAAVDATVGDQKLARGDRVLLSWAAANHDPERFPCPEQVDLDRYPNPHTAFGLGIHRCLGAHLARIELRVMLDGVLSRLGDYHIDTEGAQRYASIGITNGFLSLPARFTPGRRTTVEETQ